ncbi:MAG: glutathione peroxidase [Candidatus Pseudobacter hemicellulosilyticus]|uniref:Glutathione peroxidase n=1 Tax=Candidatus Pseudobacter hemicellulosilyticus TaxID=3121375 RepID=A0AAJ6BIG2_9BACT|nr:MAG: glutathione peroxidase [Pseudobacter sp.]
MIRLLLLTALLFAKPSIYDFRVPSLDGGTINFSDYKGKKILIVNTASKCGFTKQYAELQELYTQYKDKLVIIGFPANNFNQQEPGSNEDIKAFCQQNYGVSFPMAEKISVKGEDMHPLYKYLTAEAKKLQIDDPVKWNFTKFLIDEKGKLVTVFPSKVKPTDPEITQYLN